MTAPSPSPLTAPQGAVLVGIAVGSIRAQLIGEASEKSRPESQRLRSLGASFVTLERRGALRGCVGSLRAARPLYLDVMRNARRAMSDPRLPPVNRDDWPELDVKVSVLTAPTAMAASDRQQLTEALRPGLDGLMLTDGARRATFLPAVWQRLADPAEFITALLSKGGWPADDWPTNLQAHRYAAYEFHGPSPREPLAEPPAQEEPTDPGAC